MEKRNEREREIDEIGREKMKVLMYYDNKVGTINP